MREILFRGKVTNKDKWVYGVPVKATSIDESEMLIIKSVFNCDEYACRGCDFEPVIPESISEFTGLTDKNGNKIFEGDIVRLTDVRYDNEWEAVVVFGNPYGEYNWGWNLQYIGKKPQVNTDILLWVEMEDVEVYCEVIGNIHDNPELLKGGAE